MLRRRSVRARATAAATLAAAVLLAAASWVLLLTLRAALVSDADDASRARARDLAGLVADGRLPATLRGAGDDSFAQVIGPDATVLGASRNVVAAAPVVPWPGPVPDPSAAFDVQVRDDGVDLESYRAWAVPAPGPAGGRALVVVGRSPEAVSETVAALGGLLVLGVPVTAGLLGVMTWLVVGRALAPVESIRADVADISAVDLHRRVVEPVTGDEIARLAVTMNAMLDRVEDSARRQREFVADASHELQSPLTRLRTRLEVAAGDAERTDWPRLVQDLLTEGAEMESLVRDLLFLARDDEGSPARTVAELVDLDDVVLEESARLRSAGRVIVDTSGVSAAPARGDRQELGRLVRNLLENAARHAQQRVVVTAGTSERGVELVVADDGPGIPAEHRSRVFDRFVRLDEARVRDRGGSGLGLAIVATIAERHDGRVEVRDEGPGAVLVVRLPPADARARPALGDTHR